MRRLKVQNKLISDDSDPFLIAEVSGNHGGDRRAACDLVTRLCESKFSAIKLQTYTADTITLKSSKSDFMIDSGPWSGRSMYELYEQAHTPWDWHEDLFQIANDFGKPIFSSPFDTTAVQFLEKLNCPIYKIASFELVDIPLIAEVAKTQKPMILSTGLASLNEICEAIEVVEKYNPENYAILHCVSGYPAPVKDFNLKTIADLKQRFDCLVGLSDHSMGSDASFAAIVMGASIIEKHVKLSNHESEDSFFSLDVTQADEFVDRCKQARLIVGDIRYGTQPSEKQNLKFRRSIYVVEGIKAGEQITLSNVRSVRPSHGLHPRYLTEIIGKYSLVDMEAGDRISFDDLSDSPVG